MLRIEPEVRKHPPTDGNPDALAFFDVLGRALREPCAAPHAASAQGREEPRGSLKRPAARLWIATVKRRTPATLGYAAQPGRLTVFFMAPLEDYAGLVVIVLPVVLAYQLYAYRVSRGRVRSGEISYWSTNSQTSAIGATPLQGCAIAQGGGGFSSLDANRDLHRSGLQRQAGQTLVVPAFPFAQSSCTLS